MVCVRIVRRSTPIVLSESERLELQGHVRKSDVKDTIANRCRAILRCADGLASAEVASELRVSTGTVYRWRRRFLEGRIEGLVGKPRMVPGYPLGDEAAREIVDWVYGGRGRPPRPITLNERERLFLENYVRNPNAMGSVTIRCRMILRCADGLNNVGVAAELGVNANTVAKWRRRFLRDRLDGLLNKSRVRRGYRLTDEKAAQTIDRFQGRPRRRRLSVFINQEERLLLEGLVRRRRGTGAIADRCRMILRCADNLTDERVALELGVEARTVRRWRRRFLTDGIEGLLGKPPTGPGHPPRDK